MSLISRRRFWAFFEALYSQELNEQSPRVASPTWLKTPLLPHQQTAVAAALHLERAKLEGIDVDAISGDSHGGKLFSSHGVLGDRVGSGKSLTALALVKAPPPPAQYKEFLLRGTSLGDGRDTGLFRVREQTVTQYGYALRQVPVSIFLVPHALIGQWETYVERDTSLRAHFIKKRTDASDITFMQRLETWDVVFVSSTMWATFKATQDIRNIMWRRVFIDEADSIGITSDVDELHGLFYWFITASWLNLVFANGASFNIVSSYTPPPETPQHVVQRVSQLQGGTHNNYIHIPGCRHNNLARRMGNMCGSYMNLNAASSQSARLIVHSSEEYIKTSFETPQIYHSNILCATPPNIRVLDNGFISNEMMERLNAGDLAGALESIGMSAHSEDEVAEAVTLSYKRELENAKRTLEYKRGLEYSSDAIKAKAIETCEQKIASLESRIRTIEDRIKTAKEQTCPICYCEVNNPALTPCCQQLFCFSCLCESLKRTAACPLCRAKITDLKTVQVVGAQGVVDAAVTEADPPKLRTKREAFIQYVKENPSAKILMFSGYDATFAGFDTRLKEEGIKYAIVNGSQARIAKLLREFAAGKYNTLFLNARNMGAGLNIETASHVVLFHRMSNDLETQIIGRAMRLGRTTPLQVVHLVHENELTVAEQQIQHI